MRVAFTRVMLGWFRGDRDRLLGRGDLALSLVMVLGLALPFVPLPGDMGTRMGVEFRAPGMAAPRSFHVTTTLSACVVLARALAYDDAATGNFTRIACD